MHDLTANEREWLDRELMPWIQTRLSDKGLEGVLDTDTRTVTVSNRQQAMAVFRALGWSMASGTICLVHPCTGFGTDSDGQFYARFVWAGFRNEQPEWAALTVEFRPATAADGPTWGVYTRAHNVADKWYPARTPPSDVVTRTYFDQYACFGSKEEAEASTVWGLQSETADEDHYIKAWRAHPVIWSPNA